MITLVLGGVRSGKSELAERLADEGTSPVVYAATSAPDPSMDHRIQAHQQRRPAHWRTVEAQRQRLAELLADTGDPVLVDSLGAWLAGHHDFEADIASLLAALHARTAPTVLVTDEVGLSVHPATELGRRFQDRLGELNRAVAAVADRSLLVVAGRVVPLGSRIEDWS